MQRLTLAKRAWLLFFFAAVVLYFYGLGRLPLVGPDEPRYTQVAREMFMRADPVTPTLGGHAWFEKPPLLYWMMMASFSLFGVSEWSARFGPACSGLLTVLIVYWMGRHVRLTDETESQDGLGLWSSAALVTSAGLIVFSRGASLDIVLTLTLTAALACFFVSEVEADEKRRHWLFAGFYAGLGLSLLAKGLVGMILPFGVVATYFMLRRQRPGRSAWISAAWGIPLALLVAAVWYAPMIARHGWAFIDEFFIQHHFARYVSNKYHHPQPIYFYIPVIMTLCLPWTVFFLTALGGAKRWNWRAPTAASKLRVFAIAWLIVFILFFSFSESKLPGYILPALPGAALLIGERLALLIRGQWDGRLAMRATGVLLILVAVTGMIYAVRSVHATIDSALIIIAPAVVAGLIALVRPHLRQLCLAAIICAVFGATVLAINFAAEAVARRESAFELLSRAAARGYASSPVFQLHTIERTSEFYAAGRVAYGPDGELIKFEGVSEVADAARQSVGPVLVIVPVEYTGQLTGFTPFETEIIGDNGTVALVAVRLRKPSE